MNKQANPIGPIIGDTVEALANIIKGKQAAPPLPQKQDQPTDGLIVNKRAAEGDLNSFGDVFEKAKMHKMKQENIKADQAFQPKANIPNPAVTSTKDKIFNHILKHKTPYAVAAVGAGALGVNQLFHHLNKSHESR